MAARRSDRRGGGGLPRVRAGPGPGRGFSGEPLGAVARVAGSGVSGRRRRTHCAVRGLAGAVLHIRPGPARGRSAESCGNTPALNAVEILPCAERLPLHMGARPLKTDVLGRTAESRGNLSIGPQGRRPSMCNTPARTGKKILRRALCVVLEQHHWAFLSLSHRVAGDVPGRGRRRGPRGPRPARFFAEMCILHSRMTVGTALSSAKCTFRRRAAPAAVAARPAAPLPGPAAARVVRICCKGPDRTGASEEKR